MDKGDFEIQAQQALDEKHIAPGKRVSIDSVRMDRLEKALLPYEKQLQRQEKFRRLLGVKELEKPTYQRYITGPLERFDKNRMAFSCMRPENPHGEALRKKFKSHTGYDHYLSPLPYGELDYEDRIARSMADAGYRACSGYDPEPFPVTPPEGRLEVKDTAWMSKLVKEVGHLRRSLYGGVSLEQTHELVS